MIRESSTPGSNQDDDNHQQAEAFFRGPALSEPLVTSTAVVYETHALLLRMSRTLPSDKAFSPALRFLHQVDRMAKVVHVTEADHLQGRAILEQHRDKDYSFCDAISFAIMERLKIKRAAAFDRHFRQYGRFEVLS